MKKWLCAMVLLVLMAAPMWGGAEATYFEGGNSRQNAVLIPTEQYACVLCMRFILRWSSV